MPLSKPSWPLWQPGEAPAGCKLYLPLAEGAGTTVRDYAGGLNGLFVGSPAWQRGPYGPQLGGFTTSNYVAVPNPPQVMASVYPCWMASLSTNPDSVASVVTIGQGRTTGASFAQLNQHWSGGAESLAYSMRNDAGTAQVSAVATGLTSLNDGQPHVVMGVSYAANDHRLYFDGRLVASLALTLSGPVTFDTLTVGCLLRASVSNAFPGSILWAGAGNGSVPDPLSLAQDLLSGQFAAVRHRSNLALWAALAPAPGAPTGSPAAMMLSGF